MTRNEAMEILRQVRDRNYSINHMSDAELAASLDAYVSLGVLKLDEPKPDPLNERIRIALALTVNTWDMNAKAKGILDALGDAGLKIVEA